MVFRHKYIMKVSAMKLQSSCTQEDLFLIISKN